MSLLYKKVLIKLSGEMLAGEQGNGIDKKTLQDIVTRLIQIAKEGVEVTIVVGGGNIFRGIKALSEGIERLAGDHMGMLATVINGIAIKSVIEKNGHAACVYSATALHPFCQQFSVEKARADLSAGTIVICVAGTGNPYFTTDSAAVLRAIELQCECVLKATKVDGVYSKDPHIYDDALRYEHITYNDVLTQRLHVMDMTAISLAMENNLPLIVFSLKECDSLIPLLSGKQKHTLISISN